MESDAAAEAVGKLERELQEALSSSWRLPCSYFVGSARAAGSAEPSLLYRRWSARPGRSQMQQLRQWASWSVSCRRRASGPRACWKLLRLAPCPLSHLVSLTCMCVL